VKKYTVYFVSLNKNSWEPCDGIKHRFTLRNKSQAVIFQCTVSCSNGVFYEDLVGVAGRRYTIFSAKTTLLRARPTGNSMT